MNAPVHFIRRVFRRLKYELVLAPRGYGRPIARDEWNRQYASGAWAHLDSVPELAHYMAIIGYIRAISDTTRVLDVGCGNGRLPQLLAPHFESYLGIDCSDVAIAAARRLNIPHAEFVVSAFEYWDRDRTVDVIVFNESLSYAHHPAALMKEYLSVLAPHGRVVVSLLDYGNHAAVWRALTPLLRTIEGARVTNEHGQAWDVRSLARLDDTGRE